LPAWWLTVKISLKDDSRDRNDNNISKNDLVPEESDHPRGGDDSDHADFKPLNRCECNQPNGRRKPVETPLDRDQHLQPEPYGQIENDPHHRGRDARKGGGEFGVVTELFNVGAPQKYE